MNNRKLLSICLVLFAVSAAVRLLVWQNNQIAMAGVQYVVTDNYKADAAALLRGDLKTFLAGPNPPSDANILLHPPGYPIFIAAVESVFGDPRALQIVQIFLNSFASILVFLIAADLFDIRTGSVAGTLVALSPQFAYHSGIILPDEMSVLPILLAVYALALTVRKPSLKWAVVCGACIGLSCWLRSNALLLPIFFALFALLLLPRNVRTRFALTLAASFILVILPITVRNYLVFDSFIPLSLGMGTTFVEGLGDLDTAGKRGLPRTDEDVMAADAARSGRPDYYGTLYSPDGVQRERERVRSGIAVVEADPLWFFTGVMSRGVNSLRLERVPVIAPERDESDTTNPILHKLNIPLKIVQKLFITGVFLPFFALGTLLLLRSGEGRRKLLVLAIVPLYYMSVQPLIHTEYRYVLAAAHILMAFSAVGVSFLIGVLLPHLPIRSNVNSVAGA